MTTSKKLTSAILLALIGIVAIAAIDPIAGEMMNSGKMMQPMMSSCPAGMNCMAMMPMNKIISSQVYLYRYSRILFPHANHETSA